MKNLKTCIYTVLGLLLLIGNAFGQEEQISGISEKDSLRYELTREYFLNTYGRSDDFNIIFPQIRTSNFPFIECLVSVTDQNGDPITGLNESNFNITENQQQVNSFTVTEQSGTTSQQVAIALVIDVSGSMGASGMAYARQAAINFVNNMGPNDRAAIIKFGTSASLVQAMTSNKDVLIAAINTLVHGGWTAMYDGFYMGIAECEPEPGVRAVIGFTDGQENNSSTTKQQVISYANQVGVPLYTIGVTGSINVSVLQELAHTTGGSYYFSPNQEGIGEIYDQISQNIASQYRIVFTTPNPIMDGADREVQVNVTFN